MREPIRFLAVLAILLGGLFGLKALSFANGASDWWSAQAAAPEPAAAQETEEAPAPVDGLPVLAEAEEEEPAQCEAASSVAFASRLSGGNRTAEEDALLRRLGQRREELNQREAELDTREALILAMEQRVDERITQLRELETQINQLVGGLEEREAEDLNAIVAWYSGMDARQASERFAALDTSRQVQIASQMAERKFSEILGSMEPNDVAALIEMMATRSVLPETAAELEERVAEAG